MTKQRYYGFASNGMQVGYDSAMQCIREYAGNHLRIPSSQQKPFEDDRLCLMTEGFHVAASAELLAEAGVGDFKSDHEFTTVFGVPIIRCIDKTHMDHVAEELSLDGEPILLCWSENVATEKEVKTIGEILSEEVAR